MLTPDDRAQIVAAIEGLRDKWRAQARQCRFDANELLKIRDDIGIERRLVAAETHETDARDVDAVLALPPLAGDGWRPIATAPTGYDVLLFAPDAEEQVIIAHRFPDDEDASWYPQHESQFRGDPYVGLEVTHWMPLPPMPQLAGDAEPKEPT